MRLSDILSSWVGPIGLRFQYWLLAILMSREGLESKHFSHIYRELKVNNHC